MGTVAVPRSTWLIAPGSPRSVTIVNDIGQTVVPLLAAVRAGRRRPRARPVGCARRWFLLAGAALSWGIGQAIWTWYEVVLDQEVPYPGLADVGYLGAVPFLLAGVLLFPSRSLRTMGRVRAVIDGLMTLFTVAFVSYGTFLGVVYMTSEGDAVRARARGRPTPPPTSSPWRWCSRCSPGGSIASAGRCRSWRPAS